MFDDINKLYFIAAILGILFVVMIFRHLRPKTWISIAKPGKLFHNFGYMDYEETGVATDIHAASSTFDQPMLRMVTEEEDKTETWMLNDSSDDDNPTDFRLKGFIDQDGFIYRQSIKGAEPVKIGYTARINDPTVPTIRPKRSWQSLWLDSEIYAFLGEPQEDPKEAKKQCVAYACLSGISFSRNGLIPSETKACAAGFFQQQFGTKEKLDVTYNDPTYQWNDTALLTSIIYSILFLILYYVYACWMRKPLLGDDLNAVFILGGCYFALWALVRQYKINRTEQSRSIQSQLDLLNKEVSLGWFDSVIGVLCFIAIIFTYNFYDYDFIPLIFAIGFGISRNGLSKNAKKPWTIISNYDDEKVIDNEEESYVSFNTMLPPVGEMTKSYKWDLDSTQGIQLQGDLEIHFSMDLLNQQRQRNPYFLQTINRTKGEYINEMFKILVLNKNYMERVRYIARYIENECRLAHISELDKLQFALDFVQEPNIEFVLDRESQSIQFAAEYVRFPDETLFDQEGDSDCKALLASMILFAMNHNVLFLSSNKWQHAAVAVELKENYWLDNYINGLTDYTDAIVVVNNRRYVYCETTGDGYRIGKLIEDMKIDDFETRIEINKRRFTESEEEAEQVLS